MLRTTLIAPAIAVLLITCCKGCCQWPCGTTRYPGLSRETYPANCGETQRGGSQDYSPVWKLRSSELAGTYVGRPYRVEFVWLTLNEDGTFFLRRGDWFWGPWDEGWRGRWNDDDADLVLCVEEEDVGSLRRPSTGRFLSRAQDGKIMLPKHMEGKELPDAAECEYVLHRDAHPEGKPVKRPWD